MRTISKLFIYGTSLEGIEQLMMLVPNFEPRRSTLSDLDKVGYKDLVKYCLGEIKNYFLKGRLKPLTSNFKGEISFNYNHKERFHGVLNEYDIYIDSISPRYIAVVFLLTSDEILWSLTEHTVRSNEFDFSKTHLREISTEGYALYQMEKTIWTGKGWIKIFGLLLYVDKLFYLKIILTTLSNKNLSYLH